LGVVVSLALFGRVVFVICLSCYSTPEFSMHTHRSGAVAVHSDSR